MGANVNLTLYEARAILVMEALREASINAPRWTDVPPYLEPSAVVGAWSSLVKAARDRTEAYDKTVARAAVERGE